MDMSQEPFLRKNFQEKCRAPRAGTPFCASLRSRNAHEQVTRAILCKKCKTNAAAQGRNAQFA